MSGTRGALPKIIDEIPLELITELSTKYTKVIVKVMRRNDRGHIATIYPRVNFETPELVKLEDWCQTMAGGGNYEIDVLDEATGLQRLLRFKFRIEGAPRPPTFLGGPQNVTDQGAPQQAPGGAPMPQRPPGGYAPPPQPWAQGLHPSQQQHYTVPPTGYRPAPGATMASDALAMKQIAKLEAELAKTQARADADRARSEEDRRRLADQAQQAREQATAERHASEMASLRALIEQNNAKPVVEPKGMADMVAAMAPFVPVLTAMVTGKASSGDKALEAQMSGVNALMQATIAQSNKGNGMQEMVATWLPIAMPIITKMMDQRGPEGQAALFQAMAENNLNGVAMMAQLIEAFSGDSEGNTPWWLPMVKETLGGMVGMTEAYISSAGGLPGQQPTPNLAPPSGALAGYSTLEAPAPAQAPQPVVQAVSAEAAPEADAGVEAAEAPQVAGQVSPQFKLMFKLLPVHYQTYEWKAILEGMHAEPPAPADQVAGLLASHLEHLISFNMLPPQLAGIKAEPRATLESLAEMMPVAKSNPQYTVEVLDHVLTFLREDGFVEGVSTPEPEPEDIDVEGEEVAEPDEVAQAS